MISQAAGTMMNKNTALLMKIAKLALPALIGAVLLSGCRPFSAEIPDGFAASGNHARLIIYSPDGFKAEIKTEKNSPRKKISFWAEALKTQLVSEGYPLIDERPFSSVNLDGIAFTWLMPLGNSYYKYLTAVSVKGKTIYIIEASAEKELFDKYENEIGIIISSVSAR